MSRSFLRCSISSFFPEEVRKHENFFFEIFRKKKKKKFLYREKKFRLRYRNWTLVLVPDTETRYTIMLAYTSHGSSWCMVIGYTAQRRGFYTKKTQTNYFLPIDPEWSRKLALFIYTLPKKFDRNIRWLHDT